MVTLGFLCMLLVMTFNVGVLLAVTLGIMTGHFMFTFIGQPALPNQYRRVAGSGAYLPEADNCCCKVEADDCNMCPSAKAGYSTILTQDY